MQKEVIKERVQATLENMAGLSNERDYDVFLKGMVHAFQEILDWEPFIEESEDDGNVSVGKS